MIYFAAFTLSFLLLLGAAAQADPANTNNQATLLRFTNAISFGAVQNTRTHKDVELVLARLAKFADRNRLKRPLPQLSAIAQCELESQAAHSGCIPNLSLWRKNNSMNFSKTAFTGAVLAFAFPVVALAQGMPQNSAAIESATLGSLSQSDRAQVQGILGLLSTGQIDAGTAAVQIDAVLSDDEVNSVLSEARKANSKALDAGQFIVDLAQPSK